MASSNQIRQIISHDCRGPVARIKGLCYVEDIAGTSNDTLRYIFRESDDVLHHLKRLEILLQRKLTHRRLKFEEWKVMLEMMLQAEEHPVKRTMLMEFRNQVIAEIFHNENMAYEPEQPLPPIHVDYEPDPKQGNDDARASDPQDYEEKQEEDI